MNNSMLAKNIISRFEEGLQNISYRWVRAHKYRLTLSHDKGITRITTVARNKQAAKDIICRCEGCPERAILSVERIYKHGSPITPSKV